MPRKPCLDCGTLTNDTRCSPCKSAKQKRRDQLRGTTTQRGLGWQHQKIRAEILADNPLCGWCGERPATTGDHIVPRSQGGTTTRDNETPSCATCNYGRGNKTPA